MNTQRVKEIIVDTLEGEIVVTVATPDTCMTFILDDEEARELSSDLFSLYAKRMPLRQLRRQE